MNPGECIHGTSHLIASDSFYCVQQLAGQSSLHFQITQYIIFLLLWRGGGGFVVSFKVLWGVQGGGLGVGGDVRRE